MVNTRTSGVIKPEYAVYSSGELDLANFAGELVPNPDAIVVSLGGELKNYEKLLRDDQVHSLLQQRQDALVAAEWEVVPGGRDSRDEAAADFLREQIAALSWDAVTRKMHQGLLYGYSAAECLWGLDGNTVILQDIRVRKPWRFGFGKSGELKLRINARTVLMPERKFWLCAWGAGDDDSPYGCGLGYNLWWPVYLKRNGAKFWAAYLDRFGMPATKAIYPDGSTDAEKKTALDAARALRSEGAVAMPAGFDVQLIEAARSSGGSYEEFLRYWDDAIAKIILSQTGTTRQGQYAGTGDVLAEVKAEMIKADADLLCESFNAGPAVWLTEWNFPGAKAPQVWRRVDNARRTEADLRRDKGIYDLGMELTDDEIARRYGDAWKRRSLGDRKSDGEGDGGPGERGAAFAEAGAPGVKLETADVKPEPEAVLTEQLAEVADPLLSSTVDAIRRELDDVLAQGGDWADFAARLDALSAPNPADLIEALEGAFLAANLTGRDDAR